MIEWADFEEVVTKKLDLDISENGNPPQHCLIKAPKTRSFFVVAGPGSGKTLVIALRALKFIFVDDVNPASILVTTFTRKAASELRSRILSWGDKLIRAFKDLNPSLRDHLEKIHLNSIVTGTLDSLIEEAFLEYRPPAAGPPIVIEEFASTALMTRVCRPKAEYNHLKKYVSELKGPEFQRYLSFSDVVATLLNIKDRFFHDRVDRLSFQNNSRNHPGVLIACSTIEKYLNELERRGLMDFALLEEKFLKWLSENGKSAALTSNIRYIFVDEYQDTNLLQEKIYFKLAESAIKKEGSIMVVGDDDQSLYRFRGATVDLFCDFPKRIQSIVKPEVVYLNRNYRSPPVLVRFCNEFIKIDAKYQEARVREKPDLEAARKHSQECPPLGMFRENPEVLAQDLAKFINALIKNKEYQFQDQKGTKYVLKLHPDGGPGDIAILTYSPQEFTRDGKKRFPKLLRDELARYSIKVFNPRGQSLGLVPEVQLLCGLILECIDPNTQIQAELPWIQQIFSDWQDKARKYINHGDSSLKDFVDGWRKKWNGKREKDEQIPLLDLVYNLVTWIPKMQTDVEGLVYLEAITRTITQAALFGKYGGAIMFKQNDPWTENYSRLEVLEDILAPLAMGTIDITEELLETLPPDRVSIMSIHQAKGLEFPVTIVDVGSNFKTERDSAFQRFPRHPLEEHRLEDELRKFCELGAPQRPALERAFDDLIRRYYVAYSRAQDILLLIGLDSVRSRIKHVATGWDRDGDWHWRNLENLVHI
ncbi:MAG: ATP-dependent helicase [Candidatus Hadarchaeales archaeon]